MVCQTSFVLVFQSIVSLMSSAIKPLLDSVSDALESIILTMHSEDFSRFALQTEKRILCSYLDSGIFKFNKSVHKLSLQGVGLSLCISFDVHIKHRDLPWVFFYSYFSNIVETNESQCSLYMRELQQFAVRVQANYLAPFLCDEFIMDR